MFIKILIHLWRKCRSILLLLVTASILFYYTFENEIEHLNSFAYTDSLPLIQNSVAHNSQTNQASAKSNEEEVSKGLTDKSSINEKNKYFPILLETEDEAVQYQQENHIEKESFHPFHPFYERKAPIPYKQINIEYPKLNQITSVRANARFKNTLLERWIARLKRVEDFAELDLHSNASIISTNFLLQSHNHDALTPVEIVPKLSHFDDPIEQRLWSSEILASVLSVLNQTNSEDHNNDVEIDTQSQYFRNLASKIGEMLLQSYDTPNNLPQIPFFWKSPIKNRYAFRRTKSSLLATNILEFLKLSHVTNDPQFDSVIQHILLSFSKSAKSFDIDYLVPAVVDASGCLPLSEERISKGEHLRESHVLKSIHRGKYIHCKVTKSLLPTHNAVDNVFVLDTIDLYLTIVKAYHLNNGNFYERKHTKISSVKTIMQSIKMLNETILFQPWLPSDSEDLLLPTSIKSKAHFDVLEDSNEVALGKEFLVSPEGAKLSSLFAISGMLFNDSSLIEQSKAIAKGYYELYNSLGEIPDIVALDNKNDSTGPFEPLKKIELIKNSHYKLDTLALGVKLDKPSENKPKHYLFSEAYPYIPQIEDVDEGRQCWKFHSWPFYVNYMKASRRPPFEFVESLIYLYKITEDYQWKLIGEDLMKRTDWSQLSIPDTGKMIRLLFALFDDNVSIDDYVINSEYNFMSRDFKVMPTYQRKYLTFQDLQDK
ncbi:alpha-1,2-Mannosidase [Kluyveromyces marxianus]